MIIMKVSFRQKQTVFLYDTGWTTKFQETLPRIKNIFLIQLIHGTISIHIFRQKTIYFSLCTHDVQLLWLVMCRACLMRCQNLVPEFNHMQSWKWYAMYYPPGRRIACWEPTCILWSTVGEARLKLGEGPLEPAFKFSNFNTCLYTLLPLTTVWAL